MRATTSIYWGILWVLLMAAVVGFHCDAINCKCSAAAKVTKLDRQIPIPHLGIYPNHKTFTQGLQISNCCQISHWLLSMYWHNSRNQIMKLRSNVKQWHYHLSAGTDGLFKQCEDRIEQWPRKYCDDCVCLSICLSAVTSLFCACYLRHGSDLLWWCRDMLCT